MKSIATLAASAAMSLCLAGGASAQNLVITGARIITGTGQVIEKGSLTVRDGKIASVAAGPAKPVAGAKVINAAGMTLIAGYIDDHRHLVKLTNNDKDAFFRDEAPKEMMDLLRSGVTTVQEGGGNGAISIELRNRVASGQIKGPRIIASTQVPAGRLPNEAAVRAAVDAAKASGADSIGENAYPSKTFPAPPTAQETANLKAGLDEAAKIGIPFQIHAVSPMAMDLAVQIGAKKLVHTPHFGWLTDDEAKAVKAAGALVSSCAGFGAPVFDVFNHDNKPTFRDGKPWPEGVLDGQGRGREAGYKPVNGRTLFDNGVDYGYCTDTEYDAKAALAHELKTLNLMFSPIDLVKIMGQNSADFIDRGKDLGTLEVGKLGDILILKNSPLDGYWYFLDPVVVIKGGVVMVDNRGKPDAGKPMGKAS